MKALRRFFQRLTSWTTSARDEEVLRAEIEDRQPAMWVTATQLPTSASHPFYRRLNELLREHGFDDFVEGQCASF